MRNLNLLLIILLTASCSHEKPDPLTILKNGQWIDLTYDFDENTIYWPTNIPFSHDTVFYGFHDKGYFYSSFKYSAEEHELFQLLEWQLCHECSNTWNRP